MLRSRLLLTAPLCLMFAVVLPGATLDFSFLGQEIDQLRFSDAPSQSCIETSYGAGYPLGCQFGVEGAGGRAVAKINGTELPAGATTISSPFSFGGSALASIFKQPGADVSNATAAISFDALISPVTPGDTFQFRLSESSSCSNTMGACENADPILVYGATSIKGNLKVGEVITAAKPVRLDFYTSVSVDNFGPITTSWTKVIDAGLTITPLSETAPKHVTTTAEVVFADPVATPEPGTLALAAAAFTALGLLVRRKPGC